MKISSLFNASRVIMATYRLGRYAHRRGTIIHRDALFCVEVEGRGGTRACGRGHLDTGRDTISRWLETRVRHVRPVPGRSGV